MTEEDVVSYFIGLPVEQFVALLGKVFEKKLPAPEEISFNRNHFFLGIADSQLESDEGEPERWSPWTISAAAYVNSAAYPPEWGLGPDWGLCQSGTCSCGVECVSNNKSGIFPVCGSLVSMT